MMEDRELEADLDALLILYHDMKRGGEFGNWNAPIVEWAKHRIDGKIEDAIQRTINRLKSGAGENALSKHYGL